LKRIDLLVSKNRNAKQPDDDEDYGQNKNCERHHETFRQPLLPPSARTNMNGSVPAAGFSSQ